MIIEPVPTNPSSPVRRGLRLAGVALPLVLLVGVVAVGALGPRAAPLSAEVPTQDPAARTPAVDGPEPEPAVLAIAFPDEVGGLQVRSVAETLEAHREQPGAGIVAVAGHLTIQSLPAECADRYLGPFGAFCERRTVLTDSPDRPFSSSYSDSSGLSGIGPHLHPRVPVGVRIPHQVVVSSTEPAAAEEALPVVVLGRFVEDAACTAGVRHCREAFVTERVAWAAGEDYPRTTTIDPALEVDLQDEHWRERRSAVRAALGWDRTLLQTAYLTPATLERVDPDAAAALRSVSAPLPVAVWYVRGLDVVTDGGAAPVVRWIVFDGWTETPIVTSEGLPDSARAGTGAAVGNGYPE